MFIISPFIFHCCFFIQEGGLFRVVPTVCRPYSSSFFLSYLDCKNKQLPTYVGSVVFLLPVEQEYPVTYGVMIELIYKEDKGEFFGKRTFCLFFVQLNTDNTVLFIGCLI